MKAPNGLFILVVFCALVFAVSWFAITALTTPLRAGASGVALMVFTGLFIWFAQTDRYAIARGLISVGAVALAAPMAAVQAVTNDMLFSMFSEQNFDERFMELDAAIAISWRYVGFGTVVALVLIIAGGMMHRTPKH